MPYEENTKILFVFCTSSVHCNCTMLLQKEILSIIHFVRSWSACLFEKLTIKNKKQQ